MYTIVHLNNINTPSALPEADEVSPKINAFKQYYVRKQELIFLARYTLLLAVMWQTN